MTKRLISCGPVSLMRQVFSICFKSWTVGTDASKVLNHIANKRKHKRKALY